MDWSKITFGVLGFAVGVVVGVVAMSAVHRGDDSAELRPVALLGVPRGSVGDAVLPVEVVNAGNQTFTVTEVRLDPQSSSDVSVDLPTGPLDVPAGGQQTVEAAVSRQCADDDSSIARGELIVSVEGSSGTEEEVSVVLPEGVAGLLTGLLRCTDR